MRYFEKQADNDNWEYLKSLTRHKWEVYKAARELGLPTTTAIAHDWNKFDPILFTTYRDFFYGPKGINGTNDPLVHEKFLAAANLHRLTSPHHYFTTKIPADNKLNYKLEAVADWYSANKRRQGYKENAPTLREWWKDDQKNLAHRLDKQTIDEVNRRLEKSSSAKIGPENALAATIIGALMGGVLWGDMAHKEFECKHRRLIGTLAGGAASGAGLGWAVKTGRL